MRVKGIVFYKDRSQREEAIDFLTNKLTRFYPIEKPTRIINSINEFRIEYNEDVWYCLQATENRRGLRANIIFYPSSIDKEIVHTIIQPMCNGIIQEIYI